MVQIVVTPTQGAVDGTPNGTPAGGVRVRSYGTDTAAIEAAATLAKSSGQPLLFDAGAYTYGGAGLDLGTDWVIKGVGRDLVTITLSAGCYLVDSASAFDAIELDGITFSGGSGAVRSKSGGNLVGKRKKITNNCFVGYTAAAISNNAGDNPYWHIVGNQFNGANSTTCIGVALSRNADASVIESNEFLKNKVHIKLDRSGFVTVRKNDMIQFGAGTQRCSIWITANNNFNAVDVTTNKFGNENLDSTDFRIAVTAEGAGTYNGDRLPDFTSAVFTGTHRIIAHENMVAGGSGNGPFVYTRGIGLRGTSIHNNYLTGSAPSYLLQYDVSPFVDDPYENVYFGEQYTEESITVTPLNLCNLGAYGSIFDPRHSAEGDSRNRHSVSGGGQDAVGYVELLTTRIPSFSLATATKIGNVTDATGGAEAAEFSVALNAEIYASWAVAPTAGQVFWVEFDLLTGSASPVSQIEMQIYSTGSSQAYIRKRMNVPSTWQRFRFPVSIGGAQASRIKFAGLSTGQVKIGRVRAYHAREPYVTGTAKFEQLNLSALPTSSAGLPAGSLWVDATAANVIKRV